MAPASGGDDGEATEVAWMRRGHRGPPLVLANPFGLATVVGVDGDGGTRARASMAMAAQFETVAG